MAGKEVASLTLSAGSGGGDGVLEILALHLHFFAHSAPRVEFARVAVAPQCRTCLVYDTTYLARETMLYPDVTTHA